jgi:thioredoxin reductase (NADPH)
VAVPFFVVLSGAMEVSRPTLDGERLVKFILTGRDPDTAGPRASSSWRLTRPPQMLETSLPGVFAVGDARSRNVKRVASAVGEGATSVHMVHQALVEL